MADKPSFKVKAKRKDKTGDYIDICAGWKNQFGSLNLKMAPNVQILVDGKDVTSDYWFSGFENAPAPNADAQALVKKIAEAFEFPG